MPSILMIIAPVNFRDEEYFEPKKIFESYKFVVHTASTVTGIINGSRGGAATSTLLLSEIEVKNYDCLVLVGGPGSYIYDNDQQIHKIAIDFNNQNKLVTAICHAPIILAKAGLLNNKNATVFAGDNQQLISLGANYTSEPVVQDGRLITADGPSSATSFANKIIEQLGT